MVSYHLSRPSSSSIQTHASSFEDARSTSSSPELVAPQRLPIMQDEHREPFTPLNDGNMGAIATPNDHQPPPHPPLPPVPTPNAQPPEAGNQDDRFDTLLELLNRRLPGGSSSQRAKASVDASTPTFRGDQTDKVDCGRWIETFEREARYYELPRRDWPMAAAKRFPADSSAANWVDSTFGTGLNFEAMWRDFRRDFLEHFTPPDALPVARTKFDNLKLSPNGNITEFNRNFTDLATRLNCVLRDSGMSSLTFSSVCLAYQTKLRGPVRVHIDQYLSQRHIFNVERERDGRPVCEVTPKELLAAAQQFASMSAHDGPAPVSISTQSQAATGTYQGTTPMDIDTMIVERFNALHRGGRLVGAGSGLGSGSGNGGSRWNGGGGGSGGSRGVSGGGGRGGGGGAGQCWECGGSGHVRSRCPTFLDRKEKEKAGKEAGKGDAQ